MHEASGTVKRSPNHLLTCYSFSNLVHIMGVLVWGGGMFGSLRLSKHGMCPSEGMSGRHEGFEKECVLDGAVDMAMAHADGTGHDACRQGK